MAFITADRIKETTTVTGTGPITLLGAVSGYRPFSSVMLSIGDTCPYAIVNANASQWEVGIATYTDVNTLTRTTIHASTADPDTDPVDFTAGVKDVFLAPTARTVLSDITSNDGTVTLTKVGPIVDLSVAIAAATENVVVQVRNNTGATLTKGTVVYINDALGQLPTVAKALATSDATSAQTLGMISADLNDNSNGYVTIIGLIDDISLDTGIYSDGDQLYLSGTTAGAFTNVKPYAPTHLVYVGVVEHAHNVHGKIFVKVQNGYELDELHNVSAQSPSNGQTIVYNSTNQLWEKNTVSLTAGVNGILPVTNGGTGVTTATGTGSVVRSTAPTLTTATFAAGTISTSTPNTITQTWNNAAVTFSALTVNVTDNASANTSTLAAFQVGGTNKVFLDKYGTWNVSNVAANIPIIYNNYNAQILIPNANTVRIGINGLDVNGSTRTIVIGNGCMLSWDADNNLGMRNGTNPQSFRIYNTYTDASNYERLGITWASNICTIGPESAGTGTPRALAFSTSNLATTGTAPSLSITAGSGTVTGAKGGSINITAGNGGAGNGGGGGSVVIAAGQAVGDNVQPSGNITLTAGANGGAGTTGSVTVQGGSASTGGAVAGGVVYIYGGAQATPGNVGTVASTGSVVIKSPDSLTSMGSSGTSTVNPTGSVSITTGNGGTISTASTQTTISNGGSGTITVTTGTGASATTVGTTRNAGNSGTITISTSAGGSASGGTTNNGGSSGSIIISTGAAGTGSTTNGTAGTVQFNIGGVNTANVLSTGLGSNAVTAIPLPSAATVTAASGNGTTITYTAANTFSVGQIVSITGLTTTTGSSLNIANMTIATASSTQFTVTNTTVGTAAATQAGTATIQSAGNSVTITGGNGSGVGAGGNIILQPGAQGTSGGDGKIRINTSAGVDTGFNFTNGYASYPTLDQSRVYVRAGLNNNTVIELRADIGIGINIANGQLLLGNGTNYVGIKEVSNSGTIGVRCATTLGASLSFPNATTAIAANTNDLALPASAFQRLNCTTACSLTGIAPVTGTGSVHVDGRMIRVYNVGTANLTLSHNSVSSAAANRFYNATGADIILAPNDYAELIWDGTNNGSGSSGWRVS